MMPALRPHLSLSDFACFIGACGAKNGEFERNLCEKFRCRHAITFSSGRAGLYHILKANGIHGKSVLVSAYTCSVVTEAIVQSGNTPVFIDTGPGSFNARITEAELKKHSKDLGAVVVTNLYGLDEFSGPDFLKRDRKFLAILDDALSPGDVPRRPAGYDYVTISCAVRKPFTCLGGGVVFTDDNGRFEALRDFTLENRVRMRPFKKLKKFLLCSLFFLAFRPAIYPFTSLVRRKTGLLKQFFDEKNHDIRKQNPEYFEDMCGFQKRIGINHIKKIDGLLRKRALVGDMYYKLLYPHFAWVKSYWKPGTPYSHIPFLHPDRDGLQAYLLSRGIDTEKYFDYSIPDIAQYGEDTGKFPNAKFISERIINLPVSMELGEKDVSRVAREILKFSGLHAAGI